MAPKNSNIHDVARRAGVSIATVSHVLNGTKHVSDDTCRRVLKAAEGLQYQPNLQARSLRLNRNQDIALFVDENCLPSAMISLFLPKLMTVLQTRYGHISTAFFQTTDQALGLIRGKSSPAFVLGGDSVGTFAPDANESVFCLNSSTENCGALSQTFPQIDLSVFFYHRLKTLISAQNGHRIVMSFKQGSLFKKYAGKETPANIRLAGSEFSSGTLCLQEAISEGVHHILFTDYSLLAGAIKYLIRHEDILYSSGVEIAFLQWDRTVEAYGLPLTVHTVPIDGMIESILSQIP